VIRLGADLQNESCPPEVPQLEGTIIWWSTQIAAGHQARVSNRSTEAVNSLIKKQMRSEYRFASELR
jgi:hypothetical protein